MTTKLHFYTERNSTGFTGRCRELPALKYHTSSGRTRDAALSGVKRLYKRKLKEGSSFVTTQFGTTLPPLKTPVTKRKVNLVSFVIDRSGSMGGLTEASVKALNANLDTLREQALKTGQETLVSVIIFDNVVETIRHLADVRTTQNVKESECRARNMTSLYDATGTAIDQLRNFQNDPNTDVAFVVVTITDGLENNSTQYNANSLKSLMQTVQATDRWTLTFLLPPGQGFSFSSRLGIPSGNVQEWTATEAGIQAYTQSNTLGFDNFYSSRSVGVNSVKTFYTDLSGITANQVKTALNDLSAQAKVLTVKKEEDIRPFVETETGKPYRIGSAYYQLTKDEKNVQAYKLLLIMEKGKKEVYGGTDARRLLGLPLNENVKVKPGNHANFDIFVQSTSLNRKLVRGTKLIVLN